MRPNDMRFDIVPIIMIVIGIVVLLAVLIFVLRRKAGDPPVDEDEYRLVYKTAVNTVDATAARALRVLVTNELDSRIRETSYIYEDEALSNTGVIVGRQGCEYNIKSLYIDREGTFKIKKRDDGNFVLLASRESKYGISNVYGGERVKKIRFEDGRAVCYVAAIRFDFTVCGDAPAQPGAPVFYDDDD